MYRSACSSRRLYCIARLVSSCRQDANNGDIVLCTLNDQGYCKKLRKDENGIALISLNKKYAPIPVREEDEFRIAGIVVG